MTDPRSTRPACQTCTRREGTYVGPQIVRDAGLLILGECPGEKEADQGLPFVGPAGRVLNGLLTKAGVDRESVSIANTTCCYLPGNPTPTAGEIEACASLLEDAILQARPKVLVAMGGTAIARLVGDRSVGKWQGSIFTTPASVMIGETKVEGVEKDIKCTGCKGKGFVKVPLVVPNVTITTKRPKMTTEVCGICVGRGTVRGQERFVSGQRKGELKPRKMEVTLTQPEGRKVVVTYHPAALLDSGLAEAPLVVSALKRARALADDRPLIEVGKNIITNPQDAAVMGMLLEANKECVIDVETDGKYGRLTCIGLAPDSDYAVTFLPTPDVMATLEKALSEPDRTLVGQNVGYDVKCLERTFKSKVKLWDTMHAAFYERPDLPEIIKPKSLETIASRSRGTYYRNWKQEFRQGDSNIFLYNAMDCAWTAAIWQEWKQRLEQTGRLTHFERNMMPALKTLIDIEEEGMQIDREKLTELHDQQVRVVDRLREEWIRETGLAPEDRASTPKMRAYFYGTLGLEKQYKGKGRNRVETLDEHACEVLLKKYPQVIALGILVNMRHAEKILSTYLEPELDLRGRWHPEYNLSGAVTGRLSGNAQQVPRTLDHCAGKVEGCVCGRTREIFVADDGDECLAVADKKQVEFRLWGVVSGDQKIQQIFDAPDGDIHQWAADRFGVPRKVIKHVVHGGMFGAGALKVVQAVSELSGGEVQLTIGQAQMFLDTLKVEFPQTFRYQAHQQDLAKRFTYITNRFGRRVYFKVTEGKVKPTEVNASLVQSPAADMLTVDAWRVREAGLKVRALVHDEVVVSCRTKDEAMLLKEVVEQPYVELGWGCPNDVGTGRTWAEAKR